MKASQPDPAKGLQQAAAAARAEGRPLHEKVLVPGEAHAGGRNPGLNLPRQGFQRHRRGQQTDPPQPLPRRAPCPGGGRPFKG